MNAKPRVCVRCGTPTTYARKLPAGYRRRGCRGLCSGCYHREYLNVRGTPGPRGSYKDQPDWVKVDRACHGVMPVQLNVAERLEAVDWCTRHGMSARETAILLRVATRTVQRLRHKLAATQQPQQVAA